METVLSLSKMTGGQVLGPCHVYMYTLANDYHGSPQDNLSGG